MNTCAALSSWHVGSHENLHTFNLIVIAKPSHFIKFGDESSLEALDLIPRNMKYSKRICLFLSRVNSVQFRKYLLHFLFK